MKYATAKKMKDAIEFKPRETVAALNLMDELREEIEKCKSAGNAFEEDAKKAAGQRDTIRANQKTEFAIWSHLKAQILKDGLNKLKDSIEAQVFDF